MLINVAKAAKENLNFTILDGREMIILPFDRSLKACTSANIFVKNLGPNCTNKILYDLFKPFGEILSSRLALDHKRKSKGYGYVLFKTPVDAEKAKTGLNDKEYDGKKLLVDLYKPAERKDPSKTFTNLYVKNLPPEVNTKEAFDGLFKDFGPRTSVALFSKEYEGKLNYYGFVNFVNHVYAAKAIEKYNDKEINGVKMYVGRALNKEQFFYEKMRRKMESRAISRKQTIYVKSKGAPLVKEDIEKMFGKYGQIKSVCIQMIRQGDQEVPTPIAFVEFTKQEDAENVHTAFTI